jgi:hypothetical protein
MIANDTELHVTLARIVDFQAQVVSLRKTMAAAENYRMSARGFLAEIEQMETEVRSYYAGRHNRVGCWQTHYSEEKSED